MANRIWKNVMASASALAMLAAPTVNAEESTAQGFALSRYEPAERGSRYFTLDSLDWRSDGMPTFGLVADYAYKPLVVYQMTESGQEELVAVTRNFAVGHLGGSLNLGDRFRVGVDLPVVIYADGTTGQIGLVTYAAPQRSGLGDLRVGGDWRFYGSASDSFRAGLGVRLFIPTGDPKAYAGDAALRGSAQLQIAGEVAQAFAWSARLGVQLSGRDSTYAGGQLGHQAQGGLAVGWKTLGGRLLVGPELAASTTFKQAFAASSTSLDLLLGAHFDVTSQWRIGAGVGRGATVALGSPSFRGLLSVEWVPPSEDPPCRAALADQQRAAYAAAELAKAQREFEEAAAAKTQAEQQRLASEKAASELAAAEAAAAHARADDDADGISNADDGCPTESGVDSADSSKNGCPTGAVVGDQLVLDLVRFETSSDRILPESNAVLEKVLAAIQKLPAHYQYRVEGHTDDRGPAAFNKDLSQRRAKSVVGWMVQKGLEAARFQAAGFGSERSLFPNDTDANRQSNRRVEFHITNLEAKP